MDGRKAVFCVCVVEQKEDRRSRHELELEAAVSKKGAANARACFVGRSCRPIIFA